MNASTYRFSKTDAGYLVNRGNEYLGSVARDGRAWIISDTARGALPGQPARYATRIDAVDALSAMLRGAAALDALPTDDELEQVGDAAQSFVQAALDAAPRECSMCRYTSGHTSWCPNRPGRVVTVPAGTHVQYAPSAPADEPCGDCGASTADCICYDQRWDRETPVAELDDRQVWLQFMLEDRAQSYGVPDDERHAALSAAISERFGPDATENTADYAVATHMSSDDLVTWAAERFPNLLAIATGRLTPSWRRDDDAHVLVEHTHCGRCDRLVESASELARTDSSGAGVRTDGEHRATAVHQRVDLVGYRMAV